MKLCVLKERIDTDPLYTLDLSCIRKHSSGTLYLYTLCDYDYRKQILKGNVYDCDTVNAKLCYHYFDGDIEEDLEDGITAISKSDLYSYKYAIKILKGRFELGEEAIRQSNYREDYEAIFNIKL